MIYIGDGAELNYLEADTKYNLEDKINKRIFTVKDTPLTYRQISILSEVGLLNETGRDKNGWRKFSLKELAYITLLMEFKKFGLQHYQLKELSELFLDSGYAYLVNLIIGLVLGQIEITIEISPDGKCDIYDPNFYILLSTNKPCVKLCLNDSVNSVLEKVGMTTFPIKWTVKKAYEFTNLIPKEEELLKIIRDKNYSTITVKKKNGEISIVHAQRSNVLKDNMTEKELIQTLNSKDFQEVSVIKRDGKIVSHTVTETIKL